MSTSPSINNTFFLKEKATIVIVYTEWNSAIVNKLRLGVKEILAQYSLIDIVEIEVPGAVEIAHIISQYAKHYTVDAYIALGCVIQGDTAHFEYVCQSVNNAITSLNLQQNAPVIMGVLTVYNQEQAFERTEGEKGNLGCVYAQTALKMISTKRKHNL